MPLVKIVASSITLGTGGSGGREGPIAQIGAGFGSLLGNLLRLRPAERRVLMAAGMGAGIGAIFRARWPERSSPPRCSTVPRSSSPKSSFRRASPRVISYCVYGMYSGWQPLFTTPPISRSAIPCGWDRTCSWPSSWPCWPRSTRTPSMAARNGSIGCRFAKHFRPAIGAFLTGLIAFALYFLVGQNQQVLAVLAFGYSAIQDAMTQDAAVTAGILLTIALGKILTTSLTIGSGGSGGVFGPSMVIGGCGGGALGVVLHHLWPWLVPHPASFVIVGMAGFFAAAAKTPFSTLIIVSEMTGGYHLLLPSLWVCTLVVHPFRQAVDLFLASGKPLPLAGPSRKLRAASLGPGAREPFLLTQATRWRCIPTIRSPRSSSGSAGPRTRCCRWWTARIDSWAWSRWTRSISPRKPLRCNRSSWPKTSCASDVQPLTPDDTLDRALELFVENDLLTLPVVTNLAERQVIGMVSRFDISSAYLRHVHGPAVARDG